MKPPLGAQVLKQPLLEDAWRHFPVSVVRDLNDYQKVVAIRGAVFMTEQDCPYEEEFDGNDLSALHLIASAGTEPIATLRVRWFAGFAKIERVCIRKSWRGSNVVKVIFAHALEIAARKGYKRALGHIQTRWWPLWSATLKCEKRPGRAEFSFSGFDYCEVEIPLPAHPQLIDYDADPYVLLRPEGDWDRVGVLERSIAPSGSSHKAA